MSRIEEWNERHLRSQADGTPAGVVALAAQLLPPGRALDLACGMGRHARYLAALGWRVDAVDGSQVAIESLRGCAGVDARIADLEAENVALEPDAYDLVVDCFYLQRDLIPHIAEAVKPGGYAAFALHLREADPAASGRFRVRPGELPEWFPKWERVHYAELPAAGGHRRPVAEMIVRRPR